MGRVRQDAVASAIVAILYGVTLASLPVAAFKDRENYLTYAERSWEIFLYYLDGGAVSLVFNEPLWLLINAALARFLEPESVVRCIIFFSASVVSYKVLRTNAAHFFWLLLILLLPQVVKNHIIHLRQGLAVAVFLLGWFDTVRYRRWTIMAMAPFIHSSFFMIYALLFVSWIAVQCRWALDLRLFFFVFSGIVTSFLVLWLGEILGARQVQYYGFLESNVSGLGFIFWTAVLSLMMAQGRKFLRDHVFEFGFIAYYLAAYFFMVVAGRVFESGLLLVLLACLAMTRWRRAFFLVGLLFYFSAQWLMRYGNPMAGFA